MAANAPLSCTCGHTLEAHDITGQLKTKCTGCKCASFERKDPNPQPSARIRGKLQKAPWWPTDHLGPIV